MSQEARRPVEFWVELERDVAAKVDAALASGETLHLALIIYLRYLEEMTRVECDRRQTIQIIASGRSLLGDRTPLRPHDGPFAPAYT